MRCRTVAHAILPMALCLCVVGSCLPSAPRAESPPPTPVLQAKVYEETVTGQFVSMIDFEDAPGREPGHAQLRHFRFDPGSTGVSPVDPDHRRDACATTGQMKYVVNVTRTGVGAMEVELPAGRSLVYKLSEVHNLSEYTLLAMAIHISSIRDDLRVHIGTDLAGWESLPLLLRPGWNHVLIDLQRLKSLPDFSPKGVREVRLRLADALGPVQFHLDDIMLIDNRRDVAGVPGGMKLSKSGMDYELRVPHWPEPFRIRQGDDGLWRMGTRQVSLAVSPPQSVSARSVATDAAGQEDLGLFGSRRVGEVQILECNAIRLRIAISWYFPTSAGEWASLAVRQVRWEHTFYPDGRWVVDVLVNNSGGRPVGSLVLSPPAEAVWSDGERGARRALEFRGSSDRYSFLLAGGSGQKAYYELNYLKPTRPEVRIGKTEAADGDVDGDGFDQAQGCYRLRARAGNCRFRLVPPEGGLADPVVCVAGRWSGPVAASSEGLAIRCLVQLPDGSVLLCLPGLLMSPRWVELTGPAPPLAED